MTSEDRAAIKDQVKDLYLSGTTSPRAISSALRARHGPKGTSLRTVERLLQTLRAEGEIQPLPLPEISKWKQVDKRITSVIKDTWGDIGSAEVVAQELTRRHPDLKVDRWIIRQLQLEMLKDRALRNPADDERYRLTRPFRGNRRIPPGTAIVALAKDEAERRKIARIIAEREEEKEYAEKLRAEAEGKLIRERERKFHKRSPEKRKAKRLAHRRHLRNT